MKYEYSDKPVAEGPALNCHQPRETGFDTIFRVITVYDPATDMVVTRFDVGCNVVQLPPHPNIHSTRLRDVSWDQFNGACYTVSSEMIVPKTGVIGGWSIKANADELSSILRGLADAIDASKKDRAKAA